MVCWAHFVLFFLVDDWRTMRKMDEKQVDIECETHHTFSCSWNSSKKNMSRKNSNSGLCSAFGIFSPAFFFFIYILYWYHYQTFRSHTSLVESQLSASHALCSGVGGTHRRRKSFEANLSRLKLLFIRFVQIFLSFSFWPTTANQSRNWNIYFFAIIKLGWSV